MNPERLLALYERIAEAPDAVPRLRRFILDLAVRGKLVAQDPTEEPASELLKRIAAEKARLVKAGERREPRNAIEIKREDLPFVSPVHWAWARLIDISRPSYGFAFKSSQFNEKKRGMPLIRIRDISKMDTEAYYEGEYDPVYLVNEDDYLVGMDGDFNLRRWSGPVALLNQRVMRVNEWRCEIEPEFVRLPLQMILDYLHGDTSLTTVKHLSAKQVNGIEIPLPPLAEQRRIVARVDELMDLLDRLGAARTAREATRDRLGAASLARLTAPDTTAEDFPDHARFALDALPALTARPDQVRALRQTILNLAVRGKLVPQDPNDEPASELLKRIAAERVRLVREGAIRSKKQPAPLVEDELPFEGPSGWRWTTLAQAFVVTGGIQKTPARTPKENAFPYLGVGNVYRNRIDLTNLKQFELQDGELGKFALKPFDIMVVEGNGSASEIGRCAMWEGQVEDCVHQNHLIRCRPIEPDVSRYAMLYLNSPLGMDEMTELAITSAGLYNLSVGKISKIAIPLPPLAEQHRIVARVDELMALCDRLEAALTTADTTRARLLHALLHAALEPADAEQEVAA